MNEWGIPDWRKPAAYGDVSGWRINRWRWEFLRRRDDLRQEFDSRCMTEYEHDLRLYHNRPDMFHQRSPHPNEPGFFISTNRIHSGAEKLPNPRIGEQRFHVISWSDRTDARVQFICDDPPDGFFRCDFDLSKPIKPQIETAEALLTEMQQKHHGKKIQRRKHPSKWLSYIRALDGREAGARWVEIAGALSLSPTDPGNVVKAAEDTYKAANKLRLNFPI
jgi:hypothetical protein